ncbi:MAG: hypothetical protein EXS16_04580 [Gemmataceae bacterium]|nr:hypothetical protein [Gemmataceae bacterium]
MNANTELPGDFGNLPADLKQAIPALPLDAMERVQGRIRAEMDRADRRQRWRSGIIGGVLAASVVIAVVGYALTYAPQRRDLPMVAERPGEVVIDDRIRLAVRSASIAPDVAKPLVRLDENRALFMD